MLSKQETTIHNESRNTVGSVWQTVLARRRLDLLHHQQPMVIVLSVRSKPEEPVSRQAWEMTLGTVFI